MLGGDGAEDVVEAVLPHLDGIGGVGDGAEGLGYFGGVAAVGGSFVPDLLGSGVVCGGGTHPGEFVEGGGVPEGEGGVDVVHGGHDADHGSTLGGFAVVVEVGKGFLDQGRLEPVNVVYQEEEGIRGGSVPRGHGFRLFQEGGSGGGMDGVEEECRVEPMVVSVHHQALPLLSQRRGKI